jgi:exodeoxyribonuclease VII small subunit
MATEKTYKQLESELEEILDNVENSSYDELDALLEDYNRGIKIVEELEKKLKTAKNTIKKVKK